MPDYNDNDPKGWCGDPSRGAALGRVSIHDERGFDGKLTLRRIPIDSGGYDPNGTYFGIGKPLYWCANEEGTIDYVMRADDREDARQQVLVKYPDAKVRR